MRVLAIETATARGSVAVVGPEGVLAQTSARTAGHLEWLVGAIAETLAQAGLAQTDVDGVAVSIGPGSFMGLRVGVTTASTWAAAANRPVVGVSTLEALAAGSCRAVATGGLVLAALDARRGEIASALFRCSGRGHERVCERLSDDLLAAPANLPDHLPPLTTPVVVVGDALERHATAIATALAPWASAAAPELWWPRAAEVGTLGRDRLLRGEHVDPFHLVPRYTREPDARDFRR
jgi:tRNA threonylcarbamoyladenosine biosynthesis protein TsaB